MATSDNEPLCKTSSSLSNISNCQNGIYMEICLMQLRSSIAIAIHCTVKKLACHLTMGEMHLICE